MSLFELLIDPYGQYVIATAIQPEGETDTLFIEPYNNIDDGCVALTDPMTLDEAEAMLAMMKRERSEVSR
jgi:hypothetical protein